MFFLIESFCGWFALIGFIIEYTAMTNDQIGCCWDALLNPEINEKFCFSEVGRLVYLEINLEGINNLDLVECI